MHDDAIRSGPPPKAPRQTDGITERVHAHVPRDVKLSEGDVNLRAEPVVSRWRWRLAAVLLVGIPLLLVLFGFVIPLVQIQLRLSRNGAIARDIVETLQAQFPGSRFTGGPSYESERIYITAWEGIDKATRPEVERWLQAHKAERRIAAEIQLDYGGDDWNVLPIKF